MNENLYQRWFVAFASEHSVRRTSIRPLTWMESQLMNYAKKEWLFCSVYETFIPSMVKDLKERQDLFWAADKRHQKVDIYSKSDEGRGDCISLHIGGTYLVLQKIREEIEYTK